MLGTAVIGLAGSIGGGFVGAMLQGRYQNRVERNRRLDRTTEIIAELDGLLMDAHPANLALLREPERVSAWMIELEGRWKTIRAQLLFLAARLDSPKTRNLAQELHTSVEFLLPGPSWLRNLPREVNEKDNFETALNISFWELERAKNLIARDALKELRTAVYANRRWGVPVSWQRRTA
jgi:hypothetical protein